MLICQIPSAAKVFLSSHLLLTLFGKLRFYRSQEVSRFFFSPKKVAHALLVVAMAEDAASVLEQFVQDGLSHNEPNL